MCGQKKISDEQIEEFKISFDGRLLFEEIYEKEKVDVNFDGDRLKELNLNLKKFNIHQKFDAEKPEIKPNSNKRKRGTPSIERMSKNKRMNLDSSHPSTKGTLDGVNDVAGVEQDILNSKEELHKCENKFCPTMFHSLIPDGEPIEECPICLCSLDGKEVALLSDCDHAYCSECIKRWRGEKWVYYCPMCRQHSHSAVFTRRRYKGAKKQKIFNDHNDCYQYDQNMMRFLDRLSPEWLTLVEYLLQSEIGDNMPYLLEEHADEIDADIVSWGAKYVSYKVRQDHSSKIIIYSTFDGITFQLMLSTENIRHEAVDNEYADLVAGWLNLQLVSSVAEIPNILNPQHDSYIMWRRFDDVHCVLSIQKMANSRPIDEEKAIMKDQLMTLLPHNFKDKNFQNEAVTDVDKVFGGFYNLDSDDDHDHDGDSDPDNDYMDDGHDDDWDVERIDPKVDEIVRNFFLVADVKQKLEMVNADGLLPY